MSEVKIASPIFIIDSAEELKIGVGRLFKPKKTIGEREAIVSSYNMNLLETAVGEHVTIFYDIKLMLNTL